MSSSAKEEAKRLVLVSCRLAYTSLALMLVTTVLQLSLGGSSTFVNVANLITIGILSGTATLIGKTIRTLNQP